MKYNRYDLIYREMGNELRSKFISEFKFFGAFDDRDEDEFNDAIKQFISDNRECKAIQRACEIFSVLDDIPHPDEIPDEWELTPYGRDRMKDAYIEKLQKKIDELTKKVNNMDADMVELIKENNELKSKMTELEEKVVEPANSAAATTITANIYQKFLASSSNKYRYSLLTEDEIRWIRENVIMSDKNLEIFESCCMSHSLREVAKKTGLSLSRVKRSSSKIIEVIILTLVKLIPDIAQKGYG